MEELDNIGNTTSFNGQKLLSGTFSNKEFQIGAYSNETVKASIGATTSDKIGLTRFETGHNIRASDIIGADPEKPSDGKYTLTFKNVDGINDFTLEPVQFAQISKGEDGKNKVEIKAGQGLGALVEAINKASDKTGVKASANVTSVFEHVIEAGETGENFTINGVKIGKINVQHKDSNGALRAAINSVKDQTGVEASVDNKGRLVLANRDGRGIQVEDPRPVKTQEEIDAYKAELKEATDKAADNAGKVANSAGVNSLKSGNATKADVANLQYHNAGPGSASAAAAGFAAADRTTTDGATIQHAATAGADAQAGQTAKSLSTTTVATKNVEDVAIAEANNINDAADLIAHLKNIQLIAKNENDAAKGIAAITSDTETVTDALQKATNARMASANSRVTDAAAIKTITKIADSIDAMINDTTGTISNTDDVNALKKLSEDLRKMAEKQTAIQKEVTDTHLAAVDINESANGAGAGVDKVGESLGTNAAGTESIARVNVAIADAHADAKKTAANIDAAVAAIDNVVKNLKTAQVNFGYEITGQQGAGASSEGKHINTETQNIFGASSWTPLGDKTLAGVADGTGGAGDASAVEFIGHDGTVLIAENKLDDMKKAHASIDDYLKSAAQEIALNAIEGFKGGDTPAFSMKGGGDDGKTDGSLAAATGLDKGTFQPAEGEAAGPLASIIPPKIGALNLQDIVTGTPEAEQIKNGLNGIQKAQTVQEARAAIAELKTVLTGIEDGVDGTKGMDDADAQKAMLAHAYNAFLDGLDEGLDWMEQNVDGLGKYSPLTDIIGLNEENAVNFGRLSLVSHNGKDIQLSMTDGNGEDMTAATGYDKDVSEYTISLRETNSKIDTKMADAMGYNAETWQAGEKGDNQNGYPAGVMTLKGAQAMIDIAETAMKMLETIRSDLGSVQNQLVSTVNNISVTQVNVKAAESNIRDVDFASESATFSKHQILAQSGVYAMSQANAVQQNVMRLLQ